MEVQSDSCCSWAYFLIFVENEDVSASLNVNTGPHMGYWRVSTYRTQFVRSHNYNIKLSIIHNLEITCGSAQQGWCSLLFWCWCIYLFIFLQLVTSSHLTALVIVNWTRVSALLLWSIPVLDSQPGFPGNRLIGRDTTSQSDGDWLGVWIWVGDVSLASQARQKQSLLTNFAKDWQRAGRQLIEEKSLRRKKATRQGAACV